MGQDTECVAEIQLPHGTREPQEILPGKAHLPERTVRHQAENHRLHPEQPFGHAVLRADQHERGDAGRVLRGYCSARMPPSDSPHRWSGCGRAAQYAEKAR